MNDSPSPASPGAGADSPDLVQVMLGECSAADADAVFEMLGNHFASDRAGAVPGRREGPRPAAWAGSFVVDHAPDEVAGVLLAGPVTADLQGGPVAVDRLRRTLAAAFAVEAAGSAAGDQEVDVQVRLTNA
uniref:GNAT family N-acetyltransferase n=1 Tax=Streptomyces sp. NBC_00003 TaxID=2903608 RepID=A0AAU2UWL7_9ACTN